MAGRRSRPIEGGDPRRSWRSIRHERQDQGRRRDVAANERLHSARRGTTIEEARRTVPIPRCDGNAPSDVTGPQPTLAFLLWIPENCVAPASSEGSWKAGIARMRTARPRLHKGCLCSLFGADLPKLPTRELISLADCCHPGLVGGVSVFADGQIA